MQEAAGDLEATLHATREGVDSTGAPLPEPHHVEHLVHAIADETAGHAVELGVEEEVLLRRQVEVEGGVLEHQSDVAPDLAPLGHHVVARHQRGAARRLDERAQHPDRRRLARAVRPEEAERLPRRNLEVDAAHRDELSVALLEPPHRHRRPCVALLQIRHLPTSRPPATRQWRLSIMASTRSYPSRHPTTGSCQPPALAISASASLGPHE